MTTLSIICAFRDARWALPTLLSSLDQARLPDWELILVDDGSSDFPRKVTDPYSDEWGCVRYIRLDEPGGPASARNRGMEKARGDLISFVDADDWVGPNYFADMVELMERTGADFGRTNQTRVQRSQRDLFRPTGPAYGRTANPRSWIFPVDGASMVDFPYSHSGVFHRRLLDQGLLMMPEGLWTAEDRPWIWRLHLYAESFIRIPTFEYFYRRGVTSSLTQVGDARQLDFLPSFGQVLNIFESDPSVVEYLPKAVRQVLAVADHHLDHRDRLEPGLRDLLLTRLPVLLKRVPEKQLSEQLAAIGMRRADRLRHFVPELHAL